MLKDADVQEGEDDDQQEGEQASMNLALNLAFRVRIIPAPIDVLNCLGSTAPLLVDGTAIFKAVACDAHVDWKHGGQILHIVYLAEKLLSRMLEKDVPIQMFFFEGEWPMFPSASHRLGWLVCAEHFRRACKGSDCRTPSQLTHHMLPGSYLDSTGQQAFSRLLTATNPSCVITDFGIGLPPATEEPSAHAGVPLRTILALRSYLFVHWLHSQSLHVVDVESLDVAGPRFLGELLQTRKGLGLDALGAAMGWFSTFEGKAKWPLPCQSPESSEAAGDCG